MSAKYNPVAPLAGRLETLRSLVRRDTCSHDWVHVQGATICCQCGADLDKLLTEYRKVSDPEAGGVRVAVTVDADQTMEPEPHAPSFLDSLRTVPLWLAPVAVVIGGVIGWMVIK